MNLIPEPQQVTWGEGVCILAWDKKIVLGTTCDASAYDYAVLLQKEMERCMGYGLPVTRGMSKAAVIVLNVTQDFVLEEYTVIVEKERITVTGGAGGGLLYGVQTLRQMIRQAGACIPCGKIYDFPAIAHRGLFYDVTRGRIPTLAYLKVLADKMAFYKLNQLQLYVEHSFLFENLSEVWRDDTPITPQEILELDKYCRKLNIELVPCISTFGHLYKILRTKTFGHLCELPDVRNVPFSFVDRMEHHTIDVSNPESLKFIEGLIDEYLPLFTSDYFNLCADETFDLGKGKSRDLAETMGTDRMYLDYVKHLCEFIVRRGKTPMFWGDIICGFPEAVRDLPEGTICLNWGYEPDQSDVSVKKLALAGTVQYLCPGVCGWDQFVNRMKDSYENIRRMCAYAVKYEAIGVLNTDWGDCGHINHPDFGVPGMIYGAAFSWNTNILDFEEINRRISLIEYMDRSGEFVDVVASIAKHSAFTWRDAVNFMEGRKSKWMPGAVDTREEPSVMSASQSAQEEETAVYASQSTQEEEPVMPTAQEALAEEPVMPTAQEMLARTPAVQEALAEITQELYSILTELGLDMRYRVKPYIVAIKGMQIIQQLGIVLGEREYGISPAMDVDAKVLAESLEEWLYMFKEEWRSVGKEAELYRIEHVICWYADYLRG